MILIIPWYPMVLRQMSVPLLILAGCGSLALIPYFCPTVYSRTTPPEADPDADKKKRNRAIAIGLYIVAVIPLITLDSIGHDIWGLSLTLLLVAAATILLITNSSSDDKEDEEERPMTPQQELKRSIDKLIGAAGLVVFLVLSITTQMWYITWLVFPIAGAVKGLISAILDLKEAVKYEN